MSVDRQKAGCPNFLFLSFGESVSTKGCGVKLRVEAFAAAAGEKSLSPVPKGGSETRATSPNRWVKVGEIHGSSQWRKDGEAES